jgi:hypothetical protein
MWKNLQDINWSSRTLKKYATKINADILKLHFFYHQGVEMWVKVSPVDGSYKYYVTPENFELRIYELVSWRNICSIRTISRHTYSICSQEIVLVAAFLSVGILRTWLGSSTCTVYYHMHDESLLLEMLYCRARKMKSQRNCKISIQFVMAFSSTHFFPFSLLFVCMYVYLYICMCACIIPPDACIENSTQSASA